MLFDTVKSYIHVMLDFSTFFGLLSIFYIPKLFSDFEFRQTEFWIINLGKLNFRRKKRGCSLL